MTINPQIAKLLEAFTVVLLLCASAALVFLLLNPFQPLAVDFAPIWAAAADPSQAYDTAAITRAQIPLLEMQLGPRPFAYPPTALLPFTPLAAVPFFAAYVIFVSLAYALFVGVSLRAGVPWWVAAFPPVVMLVHVGQPTLLVGGLILAGFLLSDWRLRGLLFGLAVAIKPQLCLFLPVALLIQRDWRTVVLMAAIPSFLAIAATIVFGITIWSEWLTATRELRAFVLSSPSLSASMIHTNPILFAIPAVLLVWFTRTAETATRFSATVGAALLVSPYAMNYELALLAPGVAFLSRTKPWMLIAALVLGLAFFAFEMTVLVSVLLALLWASRTSAPAGARRTWMTPISSE